MPLRPPRAWFERAVEEIKASGGAKDPRAVAGAVWRDKSPGEKRALVALYERNEAMAKKKKKRKGGGGKKRRSKRTTSAPKKRRRSKKTKGTSVGSRVLAIVNKALGRK